MSEYGVALFHTTSAVMKAEKALVSRGFAIKLIPTPREFSSDCGIALRFEWARRDEVEQELARSFVEVSSVRRMSGSH